MFCFVLPLFNQEGLIEIKNIEIFQRRPGQAAKSQQLKHSYNLHRWNTNHVDLNISKQASKQAGYKKQVHVVDSMSSDLIVDLKSHITYNHPCLAQQPIDWR